MCLMVKPDLIFPSHENFEKIIQPKAIRMYNNIVLSLIRLFFERFQYQKLKKSDAQNKTENKNIKSKLKR